MTLAASARFGEIDEHALTGRRHQRCRDRGRAYLRLSPYLCRVCWSTPQRGTLCSRPDGGPAAIAPKGFQRAPQTMKKNWQNGDGAPGSSGRLMCFWTEKIGSERRQRRPCRNIKLQQEKHQASTRNPSNAKVLTYQNGRGAAEFTRRHACVLVATITNGAGIALTRRTYFGRNRQDLTRTTRCLEIFVRKYSLRKK